jgi:hypothetical protein
METYTLYAEVTFTNNANTTTKTAQIVDYTGSDTLELEASLRGKVKNLKALLPEGINWTVRKLSQEECDEAGLL